MKTIDASATATQDPPGLGEAQGRSDLGLHALALVASFHQITVDPLQLRQALGLEGKPVGVPEIQLAAKAAGLHVKRTATSWERLKTLPLPAVAVLADGGFAVLARVESDRAVLIVPGNARPLLLDKGALEALWTGSLLLVKNRLRLDNPNRPFGLAWFVPVIAKYRKVLSEVLVAALVIQLFGLATPLFSQVIVDKVLMHKSLPTLHVLAFGMLAVIVFEGILSVLKTHLMAHTSNRIDVALGGRLFSHLLRLPLRYFETRRVGDTVARVRELETIRQFITGSSVTVVLDLLFVGVFLAVMAAYSGTLTLVTLAFVPLFVGLSLVVHPLMRERLEEKFDRCQQHV